jgi:nucleotide-binding universal stress UspA family protein
MPRRILVPFELPGAEPLSDRLVEALTDMEVVTFGHYGLPEQTPPEAAREQFAEEAEAELDGLAAPFVAAGIDVTTRLMFGKNRSKAVDQVALEEDCDAELDPAPTDSIERILVPLLDTDNLERLVWFVRPLLDETTVEVTLFHVAEGEETVEDAKAMLAGARDDLVAQGFDESIVDVAVVKSDNHDAEILRKADDYDAVVMGEASPDIAERIFGTLPDRVANRTGDPVIIVRREH